MTFSKLWALTCHACLYQSINNDIGSLCVLHSIASISTQVTGLLAEQTLFFRCLPPAGENPAIKAQPTQAQIIKAKKEELLWRQCIKFLRTQKDYKNKYTESVNVLEPCHYRFAFGDQSWICDVKEHWLECWLEHIVQQCSEQFYYFNQYTSTLICNVFYIWDDTHMNTWMCDVN